MTEAELNTVAVKLTELADNLSELPSCADDGVPTDALMTAVSFFSKQCADLADELREATPLTLRS